MDDAQTGMKKLEDGALKQWVEDPPAAPEQVRIVPVEDPPASPERVRIVPRMKFNVEELKGPTEADSHPECSLRPRARLDCVPYTVLPMPQEPVWGLLYGSQATPELKLTMERGETRSPTIHHPPSDN
ncbi:hypothetical protein ACA910_001946 [Epithemia clementina (nom. ined.)]